MPQPFFSIVIPCLNEAKFLPLLLTDLQQQSWQDFEVIVVDGRSEDGTAQIAATFAPQLQLQVITSSRRNVSTQRNLGHHRAEGQWVVFMDADNRLPTYFLVGLRYQLDKTPDTDVFTTWFDVSSYENRDESAIATMYNLGLTAYAMIKKPTALGALIGARKEVTTKISFRPIKDNFEDYDFVTRAFQAGYHYKIFREPGYTYSMRRFHREGTVKMMTTMAQVNLNSLLGRSNAKFTAKYPMKGGSYYEQVGTRSLQFFNRLSQLTTTLPKSELNRLRQGLKNVWS